LKINFFDIDETLFFTFAEVKIINKNTKEVLRKVDNSMFISEPLKENEDFDFSEFQCTDTFIRTSIPNEPIVEKIIDAFNKGEHVHLVTARCSLDSKEKFIDFLKSHGIPVGHKDEGLIHVYRAGDIPGYNTGEKKKSIIRKLISENPYVIARLYDDAPSNLASFIELSNEFPECTFEAYRVQEEKISKI
jgi:hypothetical protein